MAFDKPTRNRLAKFVADARRVIADEFTEQFQSLYGISAKGDLAPLDKLSHLDDIGLATAALLRERIDYLVKTHPDDKDGRKAAVDRLAREQAFTVLNRLAAIRMAEKRDLIVESVGRGYQSRGFKVFETVAGSALGDTYHRYRRYLFCLFDELAVDLGVLFDRRSPQALLFPREPVVLALLDLLHSADLEPLWAEDETIGWIYQYYNDPEERKKMRKESAAPRNSRELAVRNQFFTPRYVVEFLTDNTLGRIWYEMTQGQTRLAEQCRYLVRRPTEIFLAEGEIAPETPDQEGLSQEALLKQPVHIPYRPLKDPRDIRLLDPACGSMHFGLYAFDLFETIYEEAWDNGFCPALQITYVSKEDFLKDVPRLIIEHNINGIDIDPRAVQIAGLSLWLRAQKAWQARNVNPVDRPRVRRSNIVCAEPMPGSPEMLQDFVTTLDPPLIGELVKTVFDKMQLAGEAGSLLKIEEEIRTAIDRARREWLKQQGDLFTRMDSSQEEFFNPAEQQVIDALRAYAEQADAGSYQRRLFADDAARGFAFIDLCRKRYDAVVMNPPFGEWSAQYKNLARDAFPNSYNDILAAFIERGGQLLRHGGHLGAITSRTCFFLSSFEKWRERVILSFLKPEIIADLGLGVMDAAMVEAAAYVLSIPMDPRQKSEMNCFRALNEQDPARKIQSMVASILKGSRPENYYIINPSSFFVVPGAPFNYWVPDRIRSAFRSFPSFEPNTGVVRVGTQTSNDERFVRTWWEVKESSIIRRPNSPVGNDAWVAFSKGGGMSRFYCDFPLVVNWHRDGKEIKDFNENTGSNKGGHWSRNVRSIEYYFMPGLTWGMRASALGICAMPSGCIFSTNAYGCFPVEDPLIVLAILSSQPAAYLIDMMLEREGFSKFVPGIVQRLPFPKYIPPEVREVLRDAALNLWKSVRDERSWSETSYSFEGTLIPDKTKKLNACFKDYRLTIEKLENDQMLHENRINSVTYSIYLFTGEDRTVIEKRFSSHSEKGSEGSSSRKEDEDVSLSDTTSYVQNLVSFALGTIFGRWEVRYSTGQRQVSNLPGLFEALPICPPGMLQNAEGLPAEPKDVPADYPLRISWPGILVDDENHPEDIVARIREAIEVIWKDRGEAIEQEACEILGVKSLRDYFRRPATFFADHLKRYSKSRRQAPIYWPLSTKSGSYTLWLYYHRLTDQTLHTCLADFLDPKIRKVQSELDALTASGQSGTRAGELREFLDELKDLRDEIERIIKLPWKPNLNDGVLITASPLWKLFRLPKWQKDLKVCWEKLEKGEYDWAHLAYSIWPTRVEDVCKKDRSIAIAHGLEHLCKVAPPKAKGTRGRKKVSPVTEELDL
ncbi:hypothetical protein SAMN05660860_00131 [Geoalkalibacter ferrihydriticus]|uniref:site-specific DNA-methyltransferase (adenine-specific) n=1 Tax=Geoalkalibacter ferrihydriticus TaxID=392333 RepID=A0A1G9IGZ9_9BACT|nr:BREX-1 system adenine-specific DNA-methyltransferase PglX [Geoalkalibacter ferrihydriticus]SDL24315.1 hypothetical protein SAMN05660860_00131 [Geoalkalibacter ferrihydriticus]